MCKHQAIGYCSYELIETVLMFMTFYVIHEAFSILIAN
jgi:hypothetical protein